MRLIFLPILMAFQSQVNISLDQIKHFVSESVAPLTQLANGYKEPTKSLGDHA